MRVYHRQDGNTPFRVKTLKEHFLISFEDNLLKELEAGIRALPPQKR